MSDALGRRLSRVIVVVALGAAAYYWQLGGAYTLGHIGDLEHRVADRTAELQVLNDEWERTRARADRRVARERFSFIRPGETLYRFVEIEDSGEDGTAPSEE